MSFIQGAFGRARKALLISTACFAVLMGSVPSVFAVSANPNSVREVQPDGTAVATFESIGLYWSPAGGSADVTCTVRYRVAGTSTWREGLSLWFDERDDEYRGSLVHLRSGTPYEIELTLDPSGISTSLQVSTWSDRFPIGQTVYLPEASSETLVIQNGGSANSGYTLSTRMHRERAPQSTSTGSLSTTSSSLRPLSFSAVSGYATPRPTPFASRTTSATW